MVLHTPYVLRVPYSCGVVLVFLVLVGNSYGVTYVLSVQYSCAVVSVFLFCGKANFCTVYTLLLYSLSPHSFTLLSFVVAGKLI